MIRLLNIIIIIGLVQVISNAQANRHKPGPGQDRMIEKMESMRIAFLSNELDLTTDEAIKFWPLYNEYSDKRLELRKDQFEDKRKLKHDNLSEEESKQILDEQMEVQEKELTLKKNYYDKFSVVLPAQKLAKLEPAEMEFNREVIRKLKENRERRMDKRPRR